ncbi:hypothetical protein HOO65_110052 [Ceratocystis lukuohia]|uniref:Uncharacterized protein n=1 Tax=Ceratocystis lukuohia TaxID=2019550 RepID=A0ABR4M8I3_9PEZI
MALTKQQIKIISENPLENRLDHLRERLRVDVDNPLHKDIADLLYALVGSETAFSLPSPDGNGEVEVKLSSIRRDVRKGAVRLDAFRPLVRHVVDKSADTDIWEAVFDIINNLSILTAIPASIAPASRGTFEEIKNCTFRNVGGFWEKFFDPKRWRREQEAMFEGVLTAHDGKKWTGFPKVPDEKLVWDWLRFLEERFLDHAPYRFHTTKTAD